MAAWPGWDTQLLGALRITVTADDVRFLDQWQSFEGGAARNNPLNTTLAWPRATNYNSAGVKNYRTRADGIQATAATLEEAPYAPILAALRSGNPYTYSQPLAVAQALRTWGTGTFAEVYTQATIQPLPGSGGDLNAIAGTSHMHHGWADLRNSMNKHLPTQLARSDTATRAAYRALAGKTRGRH